MLQFKPMRQVRRQKVLWKCHYLHYFDRVICQLKVLSTISQLQIKKLTKRNLIKKYIHCARTRESTESIESNRLRGETAIIEVW